MTNQSSEPWPVYEQSYVTPGHASPDFGGQPRQGFLSSSGFLRDIVLHNRHVNTTEGGPKSVDIRIEYAVS